MSFKNFFGGIIIANFFPSQKKEQGKTAHQTISQFCIKAPLLSLLLVRKLTKRAFVEKSENMSSNSQVLDQISSLAQNGAWAQMVAACEDFELDV